MVNRVTKKDREFSLVQLLPNMLTIASICAGLSSIKFGIQGNYTLAVQLILVACVLDGVDGRIARILRCDSKLGAELDSLADFLNFGVAPPLILYFWALQDTPNTAWVAVLIYAVCCVLRLARFNVSNKSENTTEDSAYFEGVPSPAGALLVMLPMYVTLAFEEPPHIPDLAICAYMVFVGLLLISSIPTWSFKTTKVSRGKVQYFLVGVVIAGAAIFVYAWETLIVLCLAYVAAVAWAWLPKRRRT